MPLNSIPEPHLEMCEVQSEDCPLPTPVEPLDEQRERVKEFLARTHLSARTQKAYRIELDRFLSWSKAQTGKGWSEITDHDVAQFKCYLQEECKTRQGKALSLSSVNQALVALKSFYKWLDQTGYLGGDGDRLERETIVPTARIPLEKLEQRSPNQLNSAQVEAMTQAILGDEDIDLRDRALLGVLIHGLQVGEVSALNVGNYQGDCLRFIRLRDQSEGIVLLQPFARKYLQQYIERRRQQESLKPDSPLFLSYDRRTPGKRLGYPGIYYFTKIRLGKAMGIPELTPHRFRQLYTSDLREDPPS